MRVKPLNPCKFASPAREWYPNGGEAAQPKTPERDKRLAVVIGRFQTPELHRGHKALLADVMQRHAHTLVLIGVRPGPPTATNPLPYHVRATMVEEYARHIQEPVTVMPLTDMRDNEQWSRRLDDVIDTVSEMRGAVLYTGRKGFTWAYTGKYGFDTLSFGCDDLAATDIRQSVGERAILNNRDFNAGIIYAYENLPHRTYHTVDMAMLRKDAGGVSVLLARKPHEKEWRFPGGFVDKDETFATAAAREMQEETGLVSEAGWEYVDDFCISDWRIVGVKGVSHKTVLMAGWYCFGSATPQDDIAETQWFDFARVAESAETMMVAEHRVLMVNGLVNYLQKRGYLR